MAERKSFLLRIEPETMAQLQRWADDELRSLNGQMEFILRKALRDAGRLSVKQTNLDQTTSPDEGDTDSANAKE